MKLPLQFVRQLKLNFFHWLTPMASAKMDMNGQHPDGFFYISNRSLYEIHRGTASVSHLSKLTNIMEIQPGLEDTLLLKEGENKAGDWGKIYWPKTKELTSLKPDLLPDVDPDDLRAFYWLEKKQRLLAFTSEDVWFVPLEEIEKLPRNRAE
jgi:hypothetical protein